MKALFFKLILLTGILFCGTAVLNSCSKADAINDISPQHSSSLTTVDPKPGKMAPTLFDRKMMVTFANYNGKDMTYMFDGYTFIFENNGNGSGIVFVYDNLADIETGKWYVNPAGSGNRISIGFDEPEWQYIFLSRDWNMFNRNNEIILTEGNSVGTVGSTDGIQIRFTERI